MSEVPSWNDAPKRVREARWGYHLLKKILGKSKKGYKILRMKDMAKEWEYILGRVDKYLSSHSNEVDASLTPEDYKKWIQNNLSKVVVHFYHRPRDTEESFVVGNSKIIRKGFKILWVYNPSETSNRFEMNLSECMGNDTLKNCAFLKMDESLNHIPVNFTVIAPHHKGLPLVYVRFEDLDFAVRLESRGPTVSLFDDLGCKCIHKTNCSNNENPPWIPLLEG